MLLCHIDLENENLSMTGQRTVRKFRREDSAYIVRP